MLKPRFKKRKKVKLFLHHGLFTEVEEDSPAPKVQHRKQVFAFSLLLILFILGFWLIGFINHAFFVKGKIKGEVLQALTFLQSGQSAITSQNPESAEEDFLNAFNSLEDAQDTLNNSGEVLKVLSNLHPYTRDAKTAIEVSKMLSKAGAETGSFMALWQNLNFDLNGGPETTPEIFEQSEEYLKRVQIDVNESLKILNEHNFEGLDDSQRIQVNEVKEKVKRLSKVLSSANDMLVLFKSFLAGDKTIFLVFQNNRELRSTGGFMGTYGLLKIKNGKIQNVKVSSVYDLDGQLSKVIIPPRQLNAVNNRWFLRDSNWFIDYKESAKKISLFYERTGGETPDFVIAVTPELITQLLKVTGPIEMSGYQTTLDTFNFVEMTQFLTSVAYDKEINTPKAMLADFMPLFLQKVMNLEGADKQRFLNELYKVIAEKNVLFFARDNNTQSILEKYKWGGRVIGTSGDYLNINVSNLGGTKTDNDILQKVELLSSLREDGSVINELTIERKNNLQIREEFKNSAYIRVLVPKGSKLVSADGFSPEPFDSAKILPEGMIDPDIDRLNTQAWVDLKTRTVIGEEAGYTSFGNWLILNGGENKTVKIVYELPFKMNSPSVKTLLVQKQPGIRQTTFKYRYEIPKNWKKLESIGEEEKHINLIKDLWFGSVVSKENN